MKKILVILNLVFLSFTGCSRIDFMFNWADTYIASKVDDYFDTTHKQSRELKKEIQSQLQSIRSEVLPVWIDRLKDIRRESSTGSLTEDRVASYFLLFLKDSEDLNARFADTAATFIAHVEPQQLDYFAKVIDKKNKEDLEKASSPEKLLSEYKDKYFDGFEMFLGSLTSEQKQRIEKSISDEPFPLDLKIKNRISITNKFLQNRNSPEKMADFVREYYRTPSLYDLPEYRQALTQYQKNLQKLITKVLVSLTEKQKLAFQENLSEKTAQLEKIVLPLLNASVSTDSSLHFANESN